MERRTVECVNIQRPRTALENSRNGEPPNQEEALFLFLFLLHTGLVLRMFFPLFRPCAFPRLRAVAGRAAAVSVAGTPRWRVTRRATTSRATAGFWRVTAKGKTSIPQWRFAQRCGLRTVLGRVYIRESESERERADSRRVDTGPRGTDLLSRTMTSVSPSPPASRSGSMGLCRRIVAGFVTDGEASSHHKPGRPGRASWPHQQAAG